MFILVMYWCIVLFSVGGNRSARRKPIKLHKYRENIQYRCVQRSVFCVLLTCTFDSIYKMRCKQRFKRCCLSSFLMLVFLFVFVFVFVLLLFWWKTIILLRDICGGRRILDLPPTLILAVMCWCHHLLETPPKRRFHLCFGVRIWCKDLFCLWEELVVGMNKSLWFLWFTDLINDLKLVDGDPLEIRHLQLQQSQFLWRPLFLQRYLQIHKLQFG